MEYWFEVTQRSRIVLIVDDSPEDQELYRRYLLRDREHSYTLAKREVRSADRKAQ